MNNSINKYFLFDDEGDLIRNRKQFFENLDINNLDLSKQFTCYMKWLINEIEIISSNDSEYHIKSPNDYEYIDYYKDDIKILQDIIDFSYIKGKKYTTQIQNNCFQNIFVIVKKNVYVAFV